MIRRGVTWCHGQGPARGTARVGRGRRRSRRGGRRPPRDLSCPVHYQRAGESMTSLDSALAHVDARTFTLQADGTPLPQTSAPGIITALLRLLDVRPGDRVLEIGTGSGYTTA